MKKTSLRILCALLLCAMLPVGSLACTKDDGQQSNTPGTTAALDSTQTTEAETTDDGLDENGYIEDDLPDDLNYKNETFHVLAWKHALPEFDVEALTGDVINDAIFNRNQIVEDRLGVDLEFTVINGNNAAVASFCNTVTNSVQSNAQAYDTVASYPRSAGSLAINHMLLDMLELEYLNFEQPWWSDSLVELNTIYNKLYFVSGDIASTLLFQMMFMIYNDDLGTNLGLTNPQKLAMEGKWTQDTMLELAANVYSDLDGNGLKSEADQYGLFSFTHPNLDIFYMGAGLNYIKPSDTGELVLANDFASEKSMAIVDKFINIFHNSNDGYFTKSLADANNLTSGNALLYNITGQLLYNNFRYSDMAYSILPAPKYDEQQEDYLTTIAFTHTQYCVPLDARDPDMSAAVLECMASESYRRVTPAIFETTFKYKYSNNPLDAEIFDLIRAGTVFDLGRPFHDELGSDTSGMVRYWRKSIEEGSNMLTTFNMAFERSWQKMLDKINEKLTVD
ncbi:MAG: hypothetical protein IJX53_08805 [Clostridia bacterium]|nr:hypothetical protein [Clostridia bacterium]